MTKVIISYSVNGDNNSNSTYNFIEKELSKNKPILIGVLKKSDKSRYFWLEVGLTKYNAVYVRSKANGEFKINVDLQSRGKSRLETNKEIIVFPKDKINVLRPKKKIDIDGRYERLEELLASIEIR